MNFREYLVDELDVIADMYIDNMMDTAMDKVDMALSGHPLRADILSMMRDLPTDSLRCGLEAEVNKVYAILNGDC